ncbi:MAG: serine/threonine protein kinase [Fimbriimonas sp.]
MSAEPAPLPVGTILAERFEVLDVLGRGGFGIAYLGQDLVREDRVVIKELAPAGTRRDSGGLLALDEDPEVSGHRLRQRFRQEALLLRRVRSSGVPYLRATFTENGTAYAITDYLAGSETLAKRLLREGRLDVEAAREILVSLLDVLERVHQAEVLHRDIKPSNVLLGPAGEVMLIDFGSAREYAATTQTVVYTPGYAPPEQLSERATRGPATDLYGLAATIYHTLLGEAPATANDRMAGVPLTPIRDRRGDVDEPLARVIEQSLALRMAERPQSVEEMRQMLSEDAPPEPIFDLRTLDDLLVRAREFRHERRGCPACEGVLVDPRPLRRLACPVCRDGTVRGRDLDESLCPNCGEGHLAVLENGHPPAICPACARGLLLVRRRGLLGGDRAADCPECGAHFEAHGERWRREDGEERTAEEWRVATGRQARLRACEVCQAQYDERPDRRWVQVVPPPDAEAVPMYPDEWARVAAGLEPGAGNACCDACRSDYWLDAHRMTLLDAPRDPYDFARDFLGRSLLIDDVRWLGVGKTSGRSGPLCDRCGTEFDREREGLRLVRSPNRRLARQSGETHVSPDWHRLAVGLPAASEEDEFRDRIDTLLRESYQAGTLPFDTGTEVHWRGRARRLDDGQDGTLVVTPTEISFGGRLRRWRVSTEEIQEIAAEENELSLTLEDEVVVFSLDPIQLVAHLRSGARDLTLTAEDLAQRLQTLE